MGGPASSTEAICQPVRPPRAPNARPRSRGGVLVGGDAPITVQTMTNTPTEDAPATIEQIRRCVEAGADIVMLDNMDPETMRAAVELAAGRCVLEASGGITLETVRAVAETGVDWISVGWITHSAPALDVALDFEA